MVENFGGLINLIVFLALTFGWAMYGYQMSIGTKQFFDKFNISHTGVIIAGFVGSFALSAAVMHFCCCSEVQEVRGSYSLISSFKRLLRRY